MGWFGRFIFHLQGMKSIATFYLFKIGVLSLNYIHKLWGVNFLQNLSV